MDYKDYIEEAKRYLEDPETLESYRTYYENAMKSIKDREQNAAAALERSYRDDLNAAAAEMRLQQRNTAQYMASRGLARSGEAEQENIERSLAYGADAAKLARQKYASLTSLAEESEKEINSLEKERLSRIADEKKRISSEARAIAGVEYEAAQKAAQNETEDRRLREEREYNESLVRLKAELSEAAAQKAREADAAEAAIKRIHEASEAEKEREFKAREYAEKRALEAETARMRYGGDTAAAGESAGSAAGETDKSGKDAEKSYTPKQTAASLAKQVITGRTASGKIKTVDDVMAVYEYLKTAEEGDISADYLKDLRTSLESYGYEEPDAVTLAAYPAAQKAKAVYKESYDGAYAKLKADGMKSKAAAANAARYAFAQEIRYCVDSLTDENVFAAACGMLGISEKDVKSFFKETGYVRKAADAEAKGGLPAMASGAKAPRLETLKN